MRIITSGLVSVMLIASSCTSVNPSNYGGCQSVDQVLADAERLNGQEAAVCGVLKYEFEDQNLYATQKAAGRQSDTHCLSLGFVEGISDDLSSLNGRSVLVFGTVTTDFCPEGILCTASCSDTGIFVKAVQRKG